MSRNEAILRTTRGFRAQLLRAITPNASRALRELCVAHATAPALGA